LTCIGLVYTFSAFCKVRTAENLGSRHWHGCWCSRFICLERTQ